MLRAGNLYQERCMPDTLTVKATRPVLGRCSRMQGRSQFPIAWDGDPKAKQCQWYQKHKFGGLPPCGRQRANSRVGHVANSRFLPHARGSRLSARGCGLDRTCHHFNKERSEAARNIILSSKFLLITGRIVYDHSWRRSTLGKTWPSTGPGS